MSLGEAYITPDQLLHGHIDEVFEQIVESTATDEELQRYQHARQLKTDVVDAIIFATQASEV